MASYLDLKRFYEELATSQLFAKEEKRLYNSLRELNTGGWNNNYQSYTLGPSNSVSSILGPVGVVPAAAVPAVPAVVPVVPAAVPVVPGAVPVVHGAVPGAVPVVPAVPGAVPVVPAVPKTVSDLVGVAAVERRKIIFDIVGIVKNDNINNNNNLASGAVSTAGMTYRKLNLKFVDSATALNTVALEISNGAEAPTRFEPVTNGLMLLLFANGNNKKDEFNQLWDNNKVSADDKLNFIKINKLVLDKTNPKIKNIDIHKLIFDKMTPEYQKYYASYKEERMVEVDKEVDNMVKIRNKMIKQGTKIVKVNEKRTFFYNPYNKEIVGAANYYLLKVAPDGTIIGGGLSRVKSKSKHPKSKEDKSSRLTLLLGAINAGNNNKKMIQEALSLLH